MVLVVMIGWRCGYDDGGEIIMAKVQNIVPFVRENEIYLFISEKKQRRKTKIRRSCSNKWSFCNTSKTKEVSRFHKAPKLSACKYIKPGRYIMYHSITMQIGKYILKCIHTLLKVENSNSFNSSFFMAFITQPE